MELTHRAQPAAVDEAGLWEAHGLRIYRYLLHLTGQREVAEDLTQETFLRAIRDRRRSLGALENESAWLFRIATNLFRDHIRRRRLIAWLPFVPHRHDRSVEDGAERSAVREGVTRVLQGLPPETAMLLLLRDGEGFSTREIADLMGLEYEAARKRLARARIQFREAFSRLGGMDS